MSKTLLERWTEECRLSLTLPPHENVVTFFSRTTAHWPDGRSSSALVMEWLEGSRPLIDYADSVGLDKPQRVALFMQALEGVSWLHAHGAPHCDLKSTNMLVIERGRRAVVKITDFGGTRARRSDPRPAIFSAHRVAPEVLAGDPAAISVCADVYSLGKELASLLGGSDATRAPEGDHRAWKAQPLRDQLGLNDHALDAIIARATQTEPSHRYADAREMLDALQEYSPPRAERWTIRADEWLWPPRVHRRSGRAMRALALVSAIVVAGAILLSNALMRVGLGPDVMVAASTLELLQRVSIFRAQDPEEMVRIAARAGIENVSGQAPATHRRVWARAIERLADAGAAVIAINIAFPRNSDPALNTVIGDAISYARTKGVPVVVGVTDYQPGSADRHKGDTPIAPEVVRAGASWGCFRLEPTQSLGHCLMIPCSSSGEVRSPFAVAAVAAILGDPPPARPVLDDSQGILRFPGEGDRGRTIQLLAVRSQRDIQTQEPLLGTSSDDKIGVYPVGVPASTAFDAIDRRLEELLAEDRAETTKVRPLVQGRIVMLSAYTPEKMFKTADGRSVPGVWIHAAAAEAMLAGIDAPAMGVRPLLPLVFCVPIGVIGVGFIMMVVARGLGLTSTQPLKVRLARPLAARTAFRRWCWMTLCAAVISMACIGVWIAAPFVTDIVLSYRAGLCIIGLGSGAMLGAAIVVTLTWMELVRRAWRRGPAMSPSVPAPR